jgi:O-antigen/teichoic acid export membrane protein
VLGRMTLVAIPLALALAWFMPHLLREGWELGPELRASAAVTAVGLAFGPLLIFRSHLDASQRGYLVNVALLVQSLVVTALSVLLAWQGFGLVGQSLAALAGLAAFTVLIVVWSRPLLKATARAPQDDATGLAPARLWSLSWPLATAAAGNRLNLMTDTIVIGKLLGAGDVAMLFLTQRIILLCAGQVNGLANSSWAALAELRQSGQTRAFETRLAELTRLIVGAGLVIVGSVAAFNRQFVALWVGPHLYGGDLLCLATLGSVVTFGFLLPYAWAIDMAGDTRHRLVASSIGSVLNVAFSVTFVLWFGIAGVALGTLCAYLLTDAWYCPWLVARRYGIRGWGIVESAGRGLLVGLPWVAAVWMLARAQGTPAGWLELLAETMVVGVLALLYCWALILNRDDRSLWTRRLRAAFA